MQLEDIRAGQLLEGVEPRRIATVVAAMPLSPGALQLIYRLDDGTLRDRLLSRDDEPTIHPALHARPWSFDGDPEAFQLAVEAKRIDLAFLFDPMLAVHASNVEPLPHQISAVYEAMLPRQPLRFVLADDPGAGKTIMAGLYIKELLLRADAVRVLIVAPGSLVEQWREELFSKFGLEFRVFSRSLEQDATSNNPFEDHERWIVRLDQLSRDEALQRKAEAAGWDLVVFDEAHKLSAHFFGTEIKRTKRFLLAEVRTERLAMEAVRRAEEARGCTVHDVSADKCGWDLTSYPPPVDGRRPEPRHMEVKGRFRGGATITITRNEILYAFNQADKSVLAIVLVGEEGDDTVDDPYYPRSPFDTEPGWGVASVTYDVKALLSPAEAPC